MLIGDIVKRRRALLDLLKLDHKKKVYMISPVGSHGSKRAGQIFIVYMSQVFDDATILICRFTLWGAAVQ